MKNVTKFINKIVGIVVTDRNGNITDGSEPIIMSASKHVRIMDQAILNNAIRSYGHNVIGVIGSNTYKELVGSKIMANMDRTLKSVIVSSDKDIQMYKNSTGEPTVLYTFDEDTTKEKKKEILFSVVQTALYEGEGDIWNPYTAIVLGGASVYDTFRGFYSAIHHSTLKAVEGSEGSKNIQNIASDYNDYQNSLIGYTLGAVVINTDEYDYTIYSNSND